MRRVSDVLFVAVLFSFSAVLIVLSLFASIKLAALDDTASKLAADTAALSEENSVLLASVEKYITIEEIERYAVQELGMCRCSPEQIETIDISEYLYDIIG